MGVEAAVFNVLSGHQVGSRLCCGGNNQSVIEICVFVKAVVNTIGGLLASRRVFCWYRSFFLFLADQLRRKHPLQVTCKTVAFKFFLTHSEVRGTLVQPTESRELHTHRTIADGGKKSPKRARNNPKVPR